MPTFLASRYDLWVVAASFLVACFASYVALDLAKRVRHAGHGLAVNWWIGGSIAMGTGIWCMHFIGMLAFTLPIALGYEAGLTLASWLAGVAVSAVALYVASLGSLKLGTLAAGALTMGLGICSMHYIGMSALDMAPGIVWQPELVAVSGLIAVAASALALLVFFWLRKVSSEHSWAYQALAAVVLGTGISGMHYTGMAAAQFPTGAVCLSANALQGSGLGTLVTLSSVALLAMTLFTSMLDARMQSKTARLANSLRLANEQLQASNAELQLRAFKDALTGLPNRLLFEDRLAQALRRLDRVGEIPGDRINERLGDRPPSRLAVLFIDIDGFKPVNDSLGHAAGDAVLIEATRRLSALARNSDTLARIGGDEFVLLMEDVTAPADCSALARRLLDALAVPFAVSNQSVQISGSVGIVLYPDQGQKDKLVSQADAAMYAAKRSGGNAVTFFESHMDVGALEQLSLQSDLRRAIELKQLQLHYQPKVDAKLGTIRGVEALLRWEHPIRGMVSPAVFVPLAERFGFIVSLGDWVIDEACRQMQEWARKGLHMRVAINLSMHQLHEPDLADRIAAAMLRNGVAPEQLLCEITESVAMDDIKRTQLAFDGLARIGVFLSIDDFGTGYSSLSYLRQLPARQLKIDRSFISDIELSRDARAIVSAVIQLAHALGLVVVAEGVETAGQRDILLTLDCDELQGYFFARPMPADSLVAWAKGHKPEGSADFSVSVLDTVHAE